MTKDSRVKQPWLEGSDSIVDAQHGDIQVPVECSVLFELRESLKQSVQKFISLRMGSLNHISGYQF